MSGVKAGSPFEDVKLTWDGKEYVVPANRVLGLIKRIEDHITLAELGAGLGTRGAVKFAQVAEAFAAALQYAGAKATADEVYTSLFPNGQGEGGGLGQALAALMMMVVPPRVQQEAQAAAEKATAEDSNRPKGTRRERRAARNSSKGTTMRSSGVAGSPPQSSGT